MNTSETTPPAQGAASAKRPTPHIMLFLMVMAFLNTMGVGIFLPVLAFIVQEYVRDQSNLAIAVEILGRFKGAPGAPTALPHGYRPDNLSHGSGTRPFSENQPRHSSAAWRIATPTRWRAPWRANPISAAASAAAARLVCAAVPTANDEVSTGSRPSSVAQPSACGASPAACQSAASASGGDTQVALGSVMAVRSVDVLQELSRHTGL